MEDGRRKRKADSWKMVDERWKMDSPGCNLLSLWLPLIECPLSGIRSFQSFAYIFTFTLTFKLAFTFTLGALTFWMLSTNIFPTFSHLLESYF